MPDTDDEQAISAEAAQLLRDRTTEILAEWTSQSRRLVLKGVNVQTLLLQDSVPTLLGNLADALENRGKDYGRLQNVALATEHGAEKHRLRCYTLPQIIDEYALLRDILVGSLHTSNSWPQAIIARVHSFLDEAISRSAAEFVKHESGKQLDEAEGERDAAIGQLDAIRQLVDVLEEDSHLRERFVALVAHDLKVPLTSIALNADLIVRGYSDQDPPHRWAKRVQRAASRIDQMIQDMLDIGHHFAGQSMKLKINSCDMVQLINEAIERLAASSQKRIRCQLPKAFCGFWDADLMHRIIDNLIRNALKFGAVDTQVTITLEDLSGAVRFSVHNHGNCLSSDEAASAFEPYGRSTDARSSQQGGWGLGLPLVRIMADAHYGTAGVSSDAAWGTCFWVVLPRDCRYKTPTKILRYKLAQHPKAPRCK